MIFNSIADALKYIILLGGSRHTKIKKAYGKQKLVENISKLRVTEFKREVHRTARLRIRLSTANGCRLKRKIEMVRHSDNILSSVFQRKYFKPRQAQYRKTGRLSYRQCKCYLPKCGESKNKDSFGVKDE